MRDYLLNQIKFTSLIYFAFALKVARNLSYRDLEHQLKELNLFDKVPDFFSMFYRFKNLNELIIGYFIKKIASLIKNFQKITYSLIDATDLDLMRVLI